MSSDAPLEVPALDRSSGATGKVAPGLHDDLAHHPQSLLRWRNDDGWMPNSQALLSRDTAPTDAVVFVHGWGGDGSRTWECFSEVIAGNEQAAKVDAFFVEYPSRSHTVAFCASVFRKFLRDLLVDPATTMVDSSLPPDAARRGPGFRYGRILLLGHSMGAVVARRALLDLGVDESQEDRFRLLFFAPAHCGSNVARLIGSGLGLDFLPGAKLVGEAARLFLRSVPDLEVNSPTLTQLAGDTKAQHATRADRALHLRAKVYHAQRDKVVEQIDFDGDWPFEPVMKQNHRSISKPNEAFKLPANALTELLRPWTSSKTARPAKP